MKYGGITKAQYLDMDVTEIERLCAVSGMPKEVQDYIWKKTASDDYAKKAIEKAKT